MTRKKQRRAPQKTGPSSPPRLTQASQANASGNHSAPALALPGIQRKLAVGKAGDTYEREADAVADRVMSGQPSPSISRIPAAGLGSTAQSKETGEEEKEAAQAQRMEEEEEAAQPQRMEEEEETAQPQRMEEEEETAQPQRMEEEEAAQPQRMEEEEAAQTQRMEEEEAAQTQRMEEEEEAAQTQRMEEEEEAQTQRMGEEEEEEAVQARSGAQAHENRADAERAMRDRGEGKPIPETVRSQIEHSTGSDLSDVRVHDDTRAQQAAKDLNARAFASGRNIWLGHGESPTNTRLMAHEAAHVVQQTGPRGPGAKARGGASPVAGLAQREGEALPTRSDINGSVLDTVAKTLIVPKITLPPAKYGGDKTAFPAEARPPGRVGDKQRLIWLRDMKVADDGVKAATPDDKALSLRPGGKTWFLRLANSSNFLIGNRANIKKGGRLPNWRNTGVIQDFQVDHMHEDQLKGPDKLDNYQLLDKATNGAKGRAIRNEIARRIKTEVRAHLDANPKPGKGKPDPYDEIRKYKGRPDTLRGKLKVTFLGRDDGELKVGGPGHMWTVDQVKKGEHLAKLTPTNDQNIIPPLGSKVELVIFRGDAGKLPEKISLDKSGQPKFGKARDYFAGVTRLLVVGVNFSPGSLSLKSQFRVKGRIVQDFDAPMQLANIGNPFTFQMPADLMQTGLQKHANLKGASPLTVTEAAISDGKFNAIARLDFTSKLFKGATADVVFDGQDIFLQKRFDGGELDIPGPIKITASTLTVGIGARGGKPNLRADGAIDFEATRIGKGTIAAKAGMQEGIEVAGEFEFDPALFKGADARIRVKYADDKFSGEGTLKIEDGQIKGIRSAELEVKIEDEKWTATGKVEPKVPGVKEGALEMIFDPNGGFEVTGKLTLGSDIPRVKGGFLKAKLKKENERYVLSGKGSAEFDIPGVTSAIQAEYHDGLFRAEATVGFERGLAKGSLTVGATNLPVDDGSGEPAGEPTETVSIYGSGTVTIRFTPWLEGTAGISIDRTGAIEVTGRVALPDSVEVFPEKKIEKKILSIGVDIPIVGVAVAGQRIGIFLNIEGNLTARAAIGPGELRDVAVEVTYNPEDESQTRITGTGRFVIPADAGLRLGISGALGAGIPVVSARAGLEIGGELGIAGEASASATVEWTPQTGINMEARVGVEAQPKFTFDLTGFVDVTADLLLTEIELYSKRWQLASVEFGSDMTFGAALTVRVENNEFQPISTDDIEFTTPEVDPIETVKGLIRSIA